MTSQDPAIIIVGAGVGGLAAAIDLSGRGYQVTVLDRAATPGGKARLERVGTALIDAGPTVFTMRWVFEDLFEDSGSDLSAHIQVRPLDVLARHTWRGNERLDLFADIDRSADAIGTFAGAREAKGYRAFCRDSAEIYNILRPTFICDQRPSAFELARRIGLMGPGLWKLKPYSTLWSSLGRYFKDPRLRQLYGRYATYCGSSPMRAPTTLMLVAHVEQQGVWAIEGGMHALVQAMHSLAVSNGVVFRYGCHVSDIISKSGRVTGVRTQDGEFIEAKAVIFNGDAQALDAMLRDATDRAVQPYHRRHRSLSAITWCAHSRTSGFPLDLHNVFFNDEYANEFRAIFQRRTPPEQPTIYICAQDRGPFATVQSGQPERLLLIVNAPADGDLNALTGDERAAIRSTALKILSDRGLAIDLDDAGAVMTTPFELNHLFPATGGALYGRATHGAFASFARPGAASALPGLYLAGGSAHPGPGVPMAAMSGRLAAAKLMEDVASGN